MRTKVINADTIDAAARLILDELKGDNNVIYFDGWDGLGASAVLRAVTQCIDVASEPPVGLRFDQIIHVDSSKWVSRRALQRVIAEQLDLSVEVMGMFDRQDEEDDYHGVAQGSRADIPEVLKAMYRRIKDLNHKFLVIFHNGSSEEIDLGSYGFPLSKYYDNKVLWTFQGRFRLYPKKKVGRAFYEGTKGRSTNLVLLASHLEGGEPQETWSALVRQEAAEIITSPGDRPARVAEFFVLFIMRLCCLSYNLAVDYDLATHACNYWICDGILHLPQGGIDDGDDVSWRSADALQLEMRLDLDYYQCNHQYFPSHLLYGTSQFPGFLLLPNADLFQDLGKITVLKLSRRTLSFTSPPFVHCQHLKFLWLDHCQDQEVISSGIDGLLQDEKKKVTQDGAVLKEYIRQCFQRLWVLDIRYTPCNRILSAQMMDLMTQLRELNVTGAEDWDMGQLQGRLPNIRKLRVTKSEINFTSGNGADLLLSGMNKVEVLDFSGNRITKSGMTSLLPVARSLETVIIGDGCIGLEKISLSGCTRLKTIVLKGSFPELQILDVSGTAVKTLDLSAVTAAQKLNELVLLDCGKLCAILWPPQEVIRQALLRKLWIDTTMQPSVSAAPRSIEENAKQGSPVATSGAGPSVMHWRAREPSGRLVSLRDARLLQSLVPFEEHFNSLVLHVEISSPISHPATVSGGSNAERIDISTCSEQQMLLCLLEQKTQLVEDNTDRPLHGQTVYEADEAPTTKLEDGGADEAPTIKQISPNLLPQNCYTYLVDQLPMKATSPPPSNQVASSTATITIPDFICDRAMILHVHDSMSINTIPGPAPLQGSRWTNLKWCRVERCPMLECVFIAPQDLGGDDACVFYSLSTFWASQLPKARFIWNWNLSSPFPIIRLPSGSFLFLASLHLDRCPRLTHVFPLPLQGLYVLETLEIMWCGDLVDVFPLETNTSDNTTVEFHSLKHIHLHELPQLKGICGRWRVYAPKLVTIRINGCWSFTRLPNVRGGSRSNRVECICEKEWWDRLDWQRKGWEGRNPNHHRSLYEPIHIPYYKKNLLRGTVLQ